MRVITRTHYDEEYEMINYLDVELVNDSGEQIYEMDIVADGGCPEDITFDRNLSPLLNIRTLIEAAYQAGKNGEDLTFAEEEADW